MTDQERKGIRETFKALFAHLRDVEMKVGAAEKVLGTYPELYAEYQKGLAVEHAATTNGLASSLEYLDRILQKSKRPKVH
jgi:hypothetical protein